GWATATSAAIHPGVPTETQGGGRCTANFVFSADGRRFLGQAAHCAGTGQATETDGCASGTRPLGTLVSIDAADGSRRTGRLAYSSWITMQSRGEIDPAACAYNDFALVELTAGDAAEASPNLPGLGGPTGLRVGGPAPGAPVFGYAGGGAGLLAKAGVHAHAVGAGFGHEIYTTSPGVPGESGSAFVDADGAAFGVLTTLNLSAEPVSNGVTDLGAALAYANEHGGLGPITLALGTEPFHAAGY
ncbi:MAG TPA: serine protease, partial [Pseudonocardia sp.]|nr:serine protease [Pseudonocardia sp.]